MHRIVLGVDMGGSSIKAGLVDVDAGILHGELHRIPTPHPSRPEDVIPVIAALAREIGGSGPVGFGAPVVVKQGRARTAANIDAAWLGCEAGAMLSREVGREVTFLNDADAAGLAEVRFGAARDEQGLVIVATLGTGIGTAIFIGGRLVPNTEFGHMEVRGMEAEHRAAARIRIAEQLDWPEWAGRVDEFLHRMHMLFWPDLFVLAGGVTEHYDLYSPHLTVPTATRPAKLGGAAGVIGAALAAAAAAGTVT